MVNNVFKIQPVRLDNITLVIRLVTDCLQKIVGLLTSIEGEMKPAGPSTDVNNTTNKDNVIVSLNNK